MIHFLLLLYIYIYISLSLSLSISIQNIYFCMYKYLYTYVYPEYTYVYLYLYIENLKLILLYTLVWLTSFIILFIYHLWPFIYFLHEQDFLLDLLIKLMMMMYYYYYYYYITSYVSIIMCTNISIRNKNNINIYMLAIIIILFNTPTCNAAQTYFLLISSNFWNIISGALSLSLSLSILNFYY